MYMCTSIGCHFVADHSYNKNAEQIKAEKYNEKYNIKSAISKKGERVLIKIFFVKVV